MKLTRSALVLAVIGVLLLVGAAVVRFAVLPSVSKLPTDLDTTQQYSGSYSGVNLAVLTGSNPGGPAIVAKAPATATRSYQASSTNGNTEIVTRTLQRSLGGQASPASKLQYAIDRSTFESTTPPSGASGVVKSQGLVFTLPLHPSTTASYRLWDENTAKAYPLTYQAKATVQGRSTYRYQSTAKGAVASPAALGLPTSVNRGALINLGPQLARLLPAQLQSQLPALVGSLPASIPLTWTANDQSVVYADTTTGAPIRVQGTQQFSAGISLLGRTIAVPVPLGTLTLATTSASEATIASDASSNASSLTLVGTTIPLVLLIVGLVLLAIAVVLAVRAGRQPGGTVPVQPAGAGTPPPAPRPSPEQTAPSDLRESGGGSRRE